MLLIVVSSSYQIKNFVLLAILSLLGIDNMGAEPDILLLEIPVFQVG
jgi:hypothetical protein